MAVDRYSYCTIKFWRVRFLWNCCWLKHPPLWESFASLKCFSQAKTDIKCLLCPSISTKHPKQLWESFPGSELMGVLLHIPGIQFEYLKRRAWRCLGHLGTTAGVLLFPGDSLLLVSLSLDLERLTFQIPAVRELIISKTVTHCN